MQLVRIAERVWMNPLAVVRVEESQDGTMWVESGGVATPDDATLFQGEVERLVGLINAELESDRQEVCLRIRRAGEIVVQAIADLARAVVSEADHASEGVQGATTLAAVPIVAGMEELAKVVVQAIADHGNDLASVISEEIRGAEAAASLLGPAIVTAIDGVIARKDGG